MLGTGDLSELALGWSTYGVGDQMSHYNVNGGVPKTLIQHLIRWVIGSGEFDDEVGVILQSVLDTEITPGTRTDRRGKRSRVARPRSAHTHCRTSRCFRCCGTASHRRRSRSWPGMPGATRPRRLAARFPGREATGLLAQRDPALAAGVRPTVLLVQPVQAIRAAQRPEGVARRFARRAATGGRRRTCRRESGWPRSSGTSRQSDQRRCARRRTSSMTPPAAAPIRTPTVDHHH